MKKTDGTLFLVAVHCAPGSMSLKGIPNDELGFSRSIKSHKISVFTEVPNLGGQVALTFAYKGLVLMRLANSTRITLGMVERSSSEAHDARQ